MPPLELKQAREIYPTLFTDFEKSVGSQIILECLIESEMDEGSARSALQGEKSAIWGDEDDDEESNGDDDDDDFEQEGKKKKNKKQKKKPSTSSSSKKVRVSSESTDVKIPSQPTRIPVTQEENLNLEICRLEQELIAPRAEEEPEDEEMVWVPPQWCVPIRADVRSFDFDALAKAQKQLTGRLFDVILTDPPWQLATSNPTRGVALGYDQLADNFIRDMPFAKLQDNGFLFMWVINAKYRFALSLFELWGYELVDEISWVKQTVNRRLAKSHGFYLQHAKETCLVGRKGNDPPGTNHSKAGGDVIYSERRGQSQKPTEIYEAIERLVPNGYYLEIFGRRNNTRNGFITIGNEL